MLAEATGLSKSAVQSALENLRRRELIVTTSDHATAVPQHRVLRHWHTRISPAHHKPLSARRSKRRISGGAYDA